jgi:soluble cytochrome b562
MKFRLVICIAGLACGAGAGLFAAEPKPAPEEITELGEQMDQMSGAFRKLRRQAGDATMNAASLELLGVMRQAAEKAQTHIPAKAAELPESERAKFTKAYRAQMNKLLAALTRTEAAFKAGDNATAVKLVGELADLQKASHREYRKPAP